MSVLGGTGLTELWALIKANFANKIGVDAASTTVDVKLKNNAGTVLQTGTLPAATQSAAGMLTAADKTKLDGIATGATAVIVDSTVTAGSTNAVSGGAVSTAITNAIAGVAQVTFVFGQSLPSTGDPLTFYFIPTSDPDTDNEWDEYIWNSTDSEWELIGTPAVDLTGYALLTDIPSEMTAADVDAICT